MGGLQRRSEIFTAGPVLREERYQQSACWSRAKRGWRLSLAGRRFGNKTGAFGVYMCRANGGLGFDAGCERRWINFWAMPSGWKHL
jgi:hypothetical protein